MALIKCPECGKEVSDKASVCINCGYPLSSEQCIKHNKIKRATFINKKIILTAILCVIIVVAGIVFAANILPNIREKQETQAILEESKESIAPYLEYIGDYMSIDENLDIADELYNSLDNVEFMGMRGKIEFGIVKSSSKSKYVKYCSWTSFDSFTEEAFQEIASKLNDYFDHESEVEAYDYSKGHTYRYFWIDPNNGYCVTCGHGLFMYSPDGGIEIIWSSEFCEDIDFYELNL